MNLPESLRNVLTQVSTVSPWALLLTKVTLLSAIAWLIHVGLARANPRWRSLLWRGTVVGLLLMVIWTLGLPSLEIHVQAPKPVTTAPGSPLQQALTEHVPAVPTVAPVQSNQGRAPVEMMPATNQTSVAVRPEVARPVESFRPSLWWRTALIGIWGFGVALLVIRLTIAYVRLAGLLKNSQAVSEEIVAEAGRIAAALGCRRTVQVRSSQQYAVPFLYGLWRPVLVLPERMCQPGYREQLRGVIAHELAHVGACDFGWNAAIQAVSTTLWFHPLVWRISSAHRAACDAVCDAVSASYLGDVQGYCRTLARVALEGAASFPAAGLAMARTCEVRRRIAVLQTNVFAAALSRRRVTGVTLVGVISLALLAGLRLALAAEAPPSEDLTADQIIDRMAKAYADCGSYQDSGVVKTEFIGGINFTNEKTFETAFVRHGRFRFEYRGEMFNPQSRYIIWSNGREVRTWWDVKPGVAKAKSLDMAVAAATGVSGGSAHTIPRLLLPDEVTGRSLTAITGRKRVEDGKLGKAECFRIEGKFGNDSTTLWIDKQSYLLRRIDEQTKLENCRTEQTTTYDPEINVTIADKLLEFRAPVTRQEASDKSRSPEATETATSLAAKKTREDPAAVAAARKILDDVAATYKSLDTYKAEGTVTMDLDTGAAKVNMETSFSILLQKPNRYLITWTQTSGMMPSMVQAGAVWNDGTQPYLYMGAIHAYSKMTSDEIAISGATGISGGSAMTVPSLFLPVLGKYAPFSRLQDPVMENTEKINGEECYVISGTSAMSKKETYWISKSTHFLMKYSRSLAPPEGGLKVPEMSDAQLDQSVRGMGLEVTEENRKKVRQMMTRSRDLMKNMKLRGTSTELYTKISTPKLRKDDFLFVPPKDAVLKESLFGGLLGGKIPGPLPAQPPRPPVQPPASAIKRVPATEPEPIPLHGTVVDVQGTPLAGATVFPLSRNAGVARFVINGVARYLTPMAVSELLQKESLHGRPVLNGEVKEDLTKTSTDAQGHFQLGESPDGPFHVGQSAPLRIVTADGHTYDVNAVVAKETIVHVPTLLNVKVKTVENVGVGELAGVVIDENGKPLEGVGVDVWDWFPGNETKTDEDGVFRLKGFDRDNKVEVRFRKPGYSPETLVDLPTGVSGWLLVLGKKTYFEGIVRGPDGKPVPRALVRANQGPKNSLRPGGMFTNIWTETTADDAGHFRLYVQPDRYQFLISAPGVGVSRFSIESIGYGNAPLHLDTIRLHPGVTFRAKVVDAQTGKPVQGLQLAPVNWQRKGLEASSDSDGLITIADLFPGEFQFAVKADGDYARWWSESATKPWQRKSIQDQRPGESNLHWQRNFDYLDFALQPYMEPVTIVVEKGARIRGRVIDPDGKPVGGATVAPALTGTGNSLTGDTRFSVTTKADGTFDMLLPASNEAQYNLVAHDGKYQQWRNWANGVLPPIHTQPGQQIDNIVLTLTRPAVVRGKVVDHQGKPLAYCDVRAHAADELGNRYYDPTTSTKPNGTFELKFVRPGEQFIQAAPFWLRAEQAPPASTQRVTVTAGQTLGDVQLTSDKSK